MGHEQLQLPRREPRKAVAEEMQDSVGDGGQLSIQLVLIIDGAGARGNGFGAVDRDEVADNTARVLKLAGGLDMGRDIAAIGIQGLAQALLVDELIVECTGFKLCDRLADETLPLVSKKDTAVV